MSIYALRVDIAKEVYNSLKDEGLLGLIQKKEI